MFGLYNTTVRIPLLIRPPGDLSAGRVDPRPGQIVDLFTTILNAAGVANDALPEGLDLLAADAPGREAIFSEYYYPAQVLSEFEPEQLKAGKDRLARFRRRLRALEVGNLRLIWSSDGRHELYDVAADPGEERNLFEARPERAREMLARLARTVDEYGGDGDAPMPEPAKLGGGPKLDPEAHEALRALGYVGESE